MTAVAALLDRLCSCRRLINVSPAPVRVSADGASARLATALETAATALGIGPIEVVSGELAKPTAVERIVAHRLGAPSEAWAALADAPASELQAMIVAAAERDPRRSFERHSIRSPRGAKLDVYTCGADDRPAWLLVLPYGVPLEMSFALAREVSRTYHFITFEGPELCDEPDRFDACGHGVDESASDVRAVLDHFGIASAHLAGLCAGVLPTLRFADLHPQRVSSLILGNGAYATHSTSETDFIALAHRVGGQRDRARVFFRFMAGQNPLHVEPECPHLTLIPYSNPDLLHMFMTAFRRLYEQLSDAVLEGWLQRIDRPSLVVVGDRDTIVPPEASYGVARRLRGSRLWVEPSGTHLSILRDPSPAGLDAMLRFCRAHDPGDRV